MEYTFLATAAFGLEGVAANELKRMNIASKAENGEEVETDLTFDFVYGENVLFVSGVAYQKDENGNVTTEKIVDETADGDSVFADRKSVV